MRKPCSDCPFKKDSPLAGSPDWLEDILNYRKENRYFEHSCHKTDPNADGYSGGKKKLECAGHLQVMFNLMDGTPGKGGVYKSLDEMIETYLRHWLGNEEFEKLKRSHAEVSV